jgi:putative photosynthetic complex assembly protein 2
MSAFLIPIACAVFVWWFGTGAVLYADGLKPGVKRWAMGAAFLIALGAVFALNQLRGEESVLAAYIGFIAAIALWGWNEMLFLSGTLTGPNKGPCPDGITGWQRFKLAAATLIYHELALVATGAAIAVASWGGSNQVGLWTFALLFAMRLSTKLNIFYGVPNMAEELLPKGVEHLKSYFGPRRRNGFFTLSIAAVTLAVGWLVWRAFDPALDAGSDAGSRAGASLLAALAVLGLLEHWLLVLPLPDAALWRWAMPAPRKTLNPDPETATRGSASPPVDYLNPAGGATPQTGTGRAS